MEGKRGGGGKRKFITNSSISNSKRPDRDKKGNKATAASSAAVAVATSHQHGTATTNEAATAVKGLGKGPRVAVSAALVNSQPTTSSGNDNGNRSGNRNRNSNSNGEGSTTKKKMKKKAKNEVGGANHMPSERVLRSRPSGNTPVKLRGGGGTRGTSGLNQVVMVDVNTLVATRKKKKRTTKLMDACTTSLKTVFEDGLITGQEATSHSSVSEFPKNMKRKPVRMPVVHEAKSVANTKKKQLANVPQNDSSTKSTTASLSKEGKMKKPEKLSPDLKKRPIIAQTNQESSKKKPRYPLENTSKSTSINETTTAASINKDPEPQSPQVDLPMDDMAGLRTSPRETIHQTSKQNMQMLDFSLQKDKAAVFSSTPSSTPADSLVAVVEREPSRYQSETVGSTAQTIGSTAPTTHDDKLTYWSNQTLKKEQVIDDLKSIEDNHYKVTSLGVTDDQLSATNDASDPMTVVNSEETASKTKQDLAIRPSLLSTSWGPAFGTTPPSSLSSSSAAAAVARALPEVKSSPLNSWFLSRGPANFKKHVSFPLKPVDEEVTPNGLITNRENSDRFFEKLADVNWRLWYGHCDPSDILDPPVTFSPSMQLLETRSMQLASHGDEKEGNQRLSNQLATSNTTQEEVNLSEEDMLLKKIKAEKEKSKDFDAMLLRALGNR